MKITHAAGHCRLFQLGSCQDCPYYRRVHGLSTNVLVVTRDEALIQRVAKGNHEGVAVRYARTGYDASAVISVFRPALAVIDELVIGNGDAGLVDALASDPRTAGMRILVAARHEPGEPTPSDAVVTGTLQEPFSCHDLLRWMTRWPVETLPPAGQNGKPDCGETGGV